MNKYDEIINIPHFELKNHKRMSIESRSAQFAPFSALTGYSDSIKEIGRLTNNKKELSEDIKELINLKLLEIGNNMKNKPFITALYFKKDNKKQGGEYIEYSGNIKKIDLIDKKLIFIDNKKININDIYDIKIDYFNN